MTLCTHCGRPVEGFFDHVDEDCLDWTSTWFNGYNPHPHHALNEMQMLRRFARAFKDGEVPDLTDTQTIALARAIERSLTVIDAMWEGVAGRSLTEEEKFGEDPA